LTSFPVVIGGDPVDAASLPQLRRGSEKLEDEVRWPFKSRGGSGDVMGSAVLFVHEPGARADKLIACLRVRVAPIELIVVRRDYAVVVLDPYRRRSQHALQEALATRLDACDPAWRELDFFPTTWHGGTLIGSSR